MGAQDVRRAWTLMMKRASPLIRIEPLGDVRPDDPADPELRTRVVRLALPPEIYALCGARHAW